MTVTVSNDDPFKHALNLADAGALTETSFSIEVEISYDRYEALCAYVGRMNRSCSWWIGDLILYGEQVFGATYAQAAEATGLAEQTLMNRVYVCGKIPPERRVAGVPFSTHAVVASLEPPEQVRWLKLAALNDWNRAQLTQALRDEAHEEGKEPLVLPAEAGQADPEDAPVTGQLSRIYDQIARALEDGGSGYYRVPRIKMNTILQEIRSLSGERP